MRCLKFVGYTDRLVEAMSVKTFQPIILVCKVVTSLWSLWLFINYSSLSRTNKQVFIAYRYYIIELLFAISCCFMGQQTREISISDILWLKQSKYLSFKEPKYWAGKFARLNKVASSWHQYHFSCRLNSAQ